SNCWPPGVPVLSCQFSVLGLNCQLPVLSSQFLSLDASGDCSLFGTRAARGGADIPAWLASSPKFAAPTLSLRHFDSEQPETTHSCNRFLIAWKSPSPAGIALPLLPACLYGSMRVPAILWHDENRTFRLSRPRARGRVRQQRNLPFLFRQWLAGRMDLANPYEMKSLCRSTGVLAQISFPLNTSRRVLHYFLLSDCPEWRLP